MTTVHPCADQDTLRRFLAGRLPDPAAGALAAHLEACDACAAAAGELSLDDAVVDATRAAAPSRPPEDEAALETLVARLCGTVAPVADADIPLRPPEAHDEIGRLAHYRVRERLGEGGLGVVFRADDMELNREVALKVLKPRFAADAGHRERFLREARAAAGVSGPHVAAVFRCGQDAGLPYLAMELLRGETLAARLARVGRLPVPEAVRVGRELAAGLAAAHAAGLVHRDVKPANVWLEAGTDRVKLLDFGLAKPGDAADLTRAGEFAGTPSHMAPEQARGEPVDARADLFGLGVTLYQALTGRLPFAGNTAWAALTALATRTPPRPRAVNPAVPAALDALVIRLLAKDRDRRPASAAAVADELVRLPADSPHRRVAVGLLAAVAIAGLAVAVRRPAPVVEPPAAADFVRLWADDFEQPSLDWRLLYNAITPPSGPDVTDGTRSLRLVGAPKNSGNAFRPLAAPAGRAVYVAARVRPSDAPLIAGAQVWRFQVNLKAATDRRSAGRTLFDCGVAPPGRWTDVLARYEFAGGFAEVATWADGRAVGFERVSAADPGFGFVELVAGNGDVWFDDVRVSVDPVGDANAAEWADAMRASVIAPGAAARDQLLAVAGLLADAPTTRLRSLAAAARYRADHTAPAVAPLRTIAAHSGVARAVAYTADGRQLVSGGADGRVRMWNAATGEPVREWDAGGAVHAVLPMTDGTLFTAGATTPPVRAWDRDGTPRFGVPGHDGPAGSLAATADGTLFSGGRDGTVRRWNATDRRATDPPARAADRWARVFVSPDGRAVLTGSERSAARLNGRPLPGAALPLATDGRRTFTVGADGSLQCWADADRPPVVLVASIGSVTCAALSPDGARLAIGRAAGDIDLRDAATGRPLARLSGHAGGVLHLSFRADGSALASAGADGAVRLWAAGP